MDGIVVMDGQGAVDESLMTGEPRARRPVERGERCPRWGSSWWKARSRSKLARRSTAAPDSLARILWNVQSSRAGVQGIADRVARIFVPLVLALAVLVSGLLLSWRKFALEHALLAGLATLIVSCPCTFGLAIPLATAAGVSTALRRGIVVTSADTFEKAPRVDIVAIDKTGILSTGEMRVVDVIGPALVRGVRGRRGAAIVPPDRASHRTTLCACQIPSERLKIVDIQPGRGALANVDGHRVAVGSSIRCLQPRAGIFRIGSPRYQKPSRQESVISYVGWDGRAYGAIITRDRPRPGWESVVDRLAEQFRVVLLTGAAHPGGYEDRVDEVLCRCSTGGKGCSHSAFEIAGNGGDDRRREQRRSRACCSRPGYRLWCTDCPGGGCGGRGHPRSSGLDRLFDTFDLIANTRRRLRQNLAWALLYNVTAIPLALTGLLNPLFAALAMSASSLLVVWNSSRPLGSSRSTWTPHDQIRCAGASWSMSAITQVYTPNNTMTAPVIWRSRG